MATTSITYSTRNVTSNRTPRCSWILVIRKHTRKFYRAEEKRLSRFGLICGDSWVRFIIASSRQPAPRRSLSNKTLMTDLTEITEKRESLIISLGNRVVLKASGPTSFLVPAISIPSSFTRTAKRWALSCLLAPSGRGREFTQPRAHLLAVPCTYYSKRQVCFGSVCRRARAMGAYYSRSSVRSFLLPIVRAGLRLPSLISLRLRLQYIQSGPLCFTIRKRDSSSSSS